MPLNISRSVASLRKRFIRDNKGSAAIYITLVTPFLIGGLAFGAELGFWEAQKKRLQNAADTAAYAAGTQLRSGLTQSDLEAAALLVATDGGYDGAVGTIATTSPPTSGAFNGDNGAVHVALTETIPRRFSGLWDQTPAVINVEAVAKVENGRPACVLALDPSASSAVGVSGSTDVTLTGCDVAANSIAPDAITQSGNAELETDCVSTVGGVDIQKPLKVTLTDCPEAIENSPLTRDPYAGRTEPAQPAGPCFAGNKFDKPNPQANRCYQNGTNVNGTVNLSAGVYYLKGGNWRFNSNADVSGTDVTLYLTDGAQIFVNGGAAFDIKAPTDPLDPYVGIAIFIDRDESNNHTLNGGADFSITGAVYGASAEITFTGNTTGSGPGECTQVIGGIVNFTGNSDFDTDCSNSGTTEIRTAQSIRVVQ